MAPTPPFNSGCLTLTLLSFFSPVRNHVPLTYHAVASTSDKSSLRLLCSRRCSRDCIHSALSPADPGVQLNWAPRRWRRPLTYTRSKNFFPHTDSARRLFNPSGTSEFV